MLAYDNWPSGKECDASDVFFRVLPYGPPSAPGYAFSLRIMATLSLVLLAGCYTPLHSPACPAASLPNVYRMPYRSVAPRLNLAKLTVPPPRDYILGANDTVEISVPDLVSGVADRPIRSRIMADDTVTLPLVGKVMIGGMNLSAAQDAINAAYAAGFLANPRVSVALTEKHTTSVSVIGEVAAPGVYALPRYENDVGHALALAGGFRDVAAEVVEVHRRVSRQDFEARMFVKTKSSETTTPDSTVAMTGFSKKSDFDGAAEGTDSLSISFANSTEVSGSAEPDFDENEADDRPSGQATPVQETALSRSVIAADDFEPAPVDDSGQIEVVLRIPLRGGVTTVAWEGGSPIESNLTAEDVTMKPGDVVVIPRLQDEVFFVVGNLSASNRVNFAVQERDRQLGNAFLIPPDRDIDAVTAVAMAGYIDPISSPDTITVHRQIPGQTPLLIHVDLIKARYDWNENVYIQPGDILYLNPDADWWMRRTFDRILPDIILSPYTNAMRYWIPGTGL